MSGGWIKLYRQLKDNEIIADPVALQLFNWILLTADKDGKCTAGRKILAGYLKQNENTIYKGLKRLEKKYQVVTIQSNNKFTEIKLINWNKYQHGESKVTQASNNQVTTKEQPSNNEVTHSKNIRIENKNKEYITSSPSAKKRPEIGKEIKTPRKQIAYPKEIVKDITAYYVNRKGIRPQGDEWLPILQAVKTMLMNGRTPQDIKDCVYWMSTHWGTWDIHTVAKRMPEFLAGALERKKMNPILADALFKRLISYDSSTDAGYRAELATENALEVKYPGWKFAEEWREARMFLQNARKKGGAEENQLLATHPMIADFRQKFLETHAVN